MTVEVFILWVLITINVMITLWNLWIAKQHWKAMDQREELAKAVANESSRRARSGDVITWHYLFGEIGRVRQTDHAFMLATFRDPYQLYPPYIRRLVGK